MNDVVVDIVTVAPYKQIHKECEKETNNHQELFLAFKHQTLATSGMLSRLIIFYIYCLAIK
jgi:hypothetical protein